MGNPASHPESLSSSHSEPFAFSHSERGEESHDAQGRLREESGDPSLTVSVKIKHSLFITFEGGEGCGKSTQARALYNRLRQQNIPVVLTHEPGGTVLGGEIRRALKRKRGCLVSPEAELFLFAASRAQLIAEVIRPALQEGKIVICDRFSYSTSAYQGYGRDLGLPIVETVNSLATQNLKPNIIVLLDLLPEQGLVRKGGLEDRFELEDISFHRRVREGYLKMAAAEPDRWLVIDASLSKRKISQIVWGKVSQLLPNLSF